MSAEPVTSAWLVGRPELVIGHYGSELTGVAWFLDDNLALPPVCPCAFIDQLSLDLDVQRFVAATDFCNGDKWIWRLELDDTLDPPALTGEVWVQDDPTHPLPLTLTRVDTFIPDDKKLCDR